VRARTIYLDARKLEVWIPGNGKLEHGQAVFAGGDGLVEFVGRDGREHPQQPSQAELLTGLSGQDQVSEMGRVERPAEDANQV